VTVADQAPKPPPKPVIVQTQTPAQKSVVVQVPLQYANIASVTKKKQREKVLAPAVDPPNSSRQQLNALDDLLQNSSTPLNSSFPMNNSFHAYRHVNPNDPTDITYSLPKYLSLFVLQLMTKINDHPPPDNLAISLNPYVSFDTKVNRYILTEGDISVQILRKLDMLFNSDKHTTNSLFAKFFNTIHSRSKST
jgi:hypothetical protein